MTGRTIVVGAGLSGLAAAWTLSESGGAVTVLESAGAPGGAVRTVQQEGFLLELGPNTVRPAPRLWELVGELGLAGEILTTDPRAPRYVDYGGALHALPMSLGGFLRTPLLSASGKWRIVTEPFRPSAPKPGESVRDFVARRLGPEAAERLVEPFVGGIFAGSAARLEVASAFPSLERWEREHGSLLRGAIASRKAAPRTPGIPRGLLSFRGGLAALPSAFAGKLGDRLRTGAAVKALEPRASGWTVDTAAGPLEAEHLVLAAPAHGAAELVAPFAPDAARALSEIPHPPLAVLHLSWDDGALVRPLDGFGHLVCPSPERRILGAVWSSSLFPGRAPAGKSLLTVFLGGARDPGALSLSDDALAAAAARDLEAQGLVRGAPRVLRVTRWERSIPQYERGHADRMAVLARAEERWPSLRLVGNYRGGVSVGDVVASGTAAALSLSSLPR
jgi:oxygen-dependent protoporphyrinogen oxidase